MLKRTNEVIEMLENEGLVIAMIETNDGSVYPIEMLDEVASDDADVNSFYYCTVEEYEENGYTTEGIELMSMEGTWSFEEEF